MKFFRKFLVLIVAMIAAITIVSGSLEVKADTGDTLIVHYYRFDGNYTPWSLWLWPNEPTPGDGANYVFNGEDGFGKVYTHTLSGSPLANSTRIGFLVRDSDWNKDVAQDRFIDMTNPNSEGQVHVYLIQDNPVVFYNLEDADISHKVLTAAFKDDNTIGFSFTKTVTADKVQIFADGVLVPTTNFRITNATGSIDINVAADLSKRYSIVVDFGDAEPASAPIGFDGFYTSDAFNDAYGYDGELGAIYTVLETTFKLWAPISDAVTLNLYSKGHRASQLDYDNVAGTDTPYQTIPMVKGAKGVWETSVQGDLDQVYYTYTVTNGLLTSEVVDPYAKSSGINGKRGMVVNFSRTNPVGWNATTRPDTMDAYTDAIIYEIHVRDYTSHATWLGNPEWRGKFLGLAQRGTTYNSVTTGLDHIIELGVTHVQLVPVFDHGIVDETRLNDPTYYGIHDGIFNWGYMPENFNVIEGSYSTDPYNGDVRITEFKEMVQTFHENGLRVVMDVVYNHTGKSADSNFDLIVPGYYFRMNSNGSFSNGSGTGNETASERYMFRKYMVDSLVFFATEYKIDGFRFDLMKLHDVETMNAVVDALHAIDPTIIIFGEPWTGGTSTLPSADAAFNANLDEMPGVAVFNDDTRDGIKGSVFLSGDKGFVQGNNFADSRVLLGVTGATAQLNLPVGALPKGTWAFEPTQTINYVTAHDNNTLHDKLKLSTYETIDKIIRMQRQSNAIVLTSQGIPFLHGGVEILRTKPCVPGGNTCEGGFDHNSYKSPDETNQINWNWKVTHIETFNYYKALIALRKAKSVFTLATKTEIAAHLFIIPDTQSGFVSYFLQDSADTWKTTYVLHNNGFEARQVKLQPGTWNVVMTTASAGAITETGLATLYTQPGGETITMQPNDTLIMYSTTSVTYVAPETETPEEEKPGIWSIFTSCGNDLPAGYDGSGSVVLAGLYISFIVVRKQLKNRKKDDSE
jgi:pullulanase